MGKTGITFQEHGRQRRFNSRRGVALLLAMLAVIVAATVASTYLATQSTSIGIARNVKQRPRARYIAETGLELAIAYIRSNSNWRSEKTQGNWVQNASYAGGTYTVVAEDGCDSNGDGTIEGDGDISASSGEDDLLTLTATGRYGNVSAVARAVMTPLAGGDSSEVLHLAFDETSGTTATDSSGNGNNGTLTNMNVPSCWDASGKLNGAIDFDGSNDYVVVPDRDTLDISEGGTVAAWVYADSISNYAGIIHKGSRTDFADEAYSLQFWSGRKIVWYVTGNSSNVQLTAPTALSTKRWYHLVGTWDSSATRIYVDGTLAASGNGITARKTTGNLMIGAQLDRNYSGYNFNGRIDDVYLFDRALTADEVEKLYNFNPPTQGGGGGGYTATPSDDTYVYYASSRDNYGGSSGLRVTFGAKSLLRFDLSSIPTNTSITSAKVSLYAMNSVFSNQSLSLYAIESGNADWQEGDRDDKQAKSGQCCWDVLAHPGTSWAGMAGLSSAGVDYEPTPLASIGGNVTQGQWYQWEINPSLVQGWIANPSTNYGMMLWTYEWQHYWFASKENNDSNTRPRLEITTSGTGGSGGYRIDWQN